MSAAEEAIELAYRSMVDTAQLEVDGVLPDESIMIRMAQSAAGERVLCATVQRPCLETDEIICEWLGAIEGGGISQDKITWVAEPKNSNEGS